MTPRTAADHAGPRCAQVSYYNGSLPVTHAGKLHMPVVKHYVAPRKDDTGMYLDGTEKYAPPSPWLGLGLANSNLGQPSHLLAGRARRFYQT